MLDIVFEMHKFCCYFLTGLIWVIQLVHYPSFSFAEEKNFSSFMNFHQARISLIVIPVMILELGLAALLVYFKAHTWSWLNLFLVLGIWLSTFTLSVPLHAKLDNHFSLKVINSLVKTNWPRTLLWTLRSVILFLITTGYIFN